MPAENKKRILIFSTAHLPLRGGAEVAVNNITGKISDFEFDLITAKIQPDLLCYERIGNISVYRIGKGKNLDKKLLPFFGLIKALRLNRKNHYQIVWSIMASYGGFAGLFYKILQPRTKFLLTLQEGDDLAYIKKRVGIFYFLFRQIFVRADYIQAISNFLAAWGKSMGAKCPIEVVPNAAGFDEGSFLINRKENHDKKIERNIITVSRLVKKNGIEYLIKAMPNINAQTKLIIVGDGELREELEELSFNLGLMKTVGSIDLEDRVIFLGDLDKPYDIAVQLSQADVFVRPSLSEGLGNAFLEAMYMKVPVIATPVGGIPDFLKDDETGWFCEVKDPKNIAEKINYILSEENKAEVARVVENAHKLVVEKYNWDRIAGEMKNIFNKLTNGQE